MSIFKTNGVMVGATLSHYKIIEEIGRGGMGIVYKAEDTKLDRTVAIKVLPSATLADDDGRERFYREARAAAALHHPHIATVFEIDEAIPSDAPRDAQPSPFIAMEFVDGGTLREEIQKGPMDLRRAVTIAGQIGEALKAAHAKDIVHRDIKSANVMLTSEGDPKVLDFGLAKTAQSTMLTRMGSTLGTIAYMSPEQARGEEVDHRTDIWSQGVVLFEMVSGRVPFAGEYDKAVMYGILNEMPPPLTSLRTGVPMGLEWIVTKMLAKSPDERYQSCSDLIVDLKTVDLNTTGMSRSTVSMASAASGMSTMESAIPTGQIADGMASKSRTSRTLAWASVLLLPLGLALGWILFNSDGAEPVAQSPTRQYSIEIPDAVDFYAISVSHDGTKFAGRRQTVQGTQELIIFDLRSGGVTVLDVDIVFMSSFSYDDQWMVYSGLSGVQRVNVAGGSPASFGTGYRTRGHTFLPDGTLLIAAIDEGNRFLLRVLPGQSESEVVLTSDSSFSVVGFPVSLHRNDLVAISVRYSASPRSIGLWDIQSNEVTQIGIGSPVGYSPSGHLIYIDGGTFQGQLFARSIDLNSKKFNGPPVAIRNSVDRRDMFVDDFGNLFVRSEGKILTANTGQIYSDGEYDTVVATNLTAATYQPRLSKDGRFLVQRTSADWGEQLVIYDIERGISRPFTVETDGDADNAVWSADGSELIFESDNKLYRKNANGSGNTLEIPTQSGTGALDWAHKGDFIIHTNSNIDGFSELYRLDLSTGESIELDGGPGRHGWPRISPDERFVSYTTSDTDGRSVWVLSLEDGNRFKIVHESNSLLTAWTSDGKYLYFDSSEGLSRIPIRLDPYFEVTGASERIMGRELLEFDLVGDGTDIYVITQPSDIASGEGAKVRFDVISNWGEELSRIAPAVDSD